jgi:hypothetical protein
MGVQSLKQAPVRPSALFCQIGRSQPTLAHVRAPCLGDAHKNLHEDPHAPSIGRRSPGRAAFCRQNRVKIGKRRNSVAELYKPCLADGTRDEGLEMGATRTKFGPARNRPLPGLVNGVWLGYRAATPVTIAERHGGAAKGGGAGR